MKRGPWGSLFNTLLASCVFLLAYRLTLRIHKGEVTYHVIQSWRNEDKNAASNQSYQGNKNHGLVIPFYMYLTAKGQKSAIYFKLFRKKIHKNNIRVWGAWVAQPVMRPTSAQVMISQFVGSSHVSGSVLTALSLEPASDSVYPSLSAPLPFTLHLSQK